MKVAEKIVGAVGIVILTVVLLYMTPVVVDAVQGINTTNWTFTGKDGAIALLGLIPFVWVAGVLISACIGMFVLARAPTTTQMISVYRVRLVSRIVKRVRSYSYSARVFTPSAFATK